MNTKENRKFQMSESTLVMVFLTLSGGLQDAYSYMIRGKVFANGQTGNIVLMADRMFSGQVIDSLRYLFPITAFALGTLVAEQLRGRIKLEGMFHWRQVIVGLELVLLSIVALLPVNTDFNPLANALTSFCCAMQVQAFRKVNGFTYASTMCVGNLRSGMESLSAYLRTGKRELYTRSIQYFEVILIFFVGAGIGSFLSVFMKQYLILVSALMLLISFLMMINYEKKEEKLKI